MVVVVVVAVITVAQTFTCMMGKFGKINLLVTSNDIVPFAL